LDAVAEGVIGVGDARRAVRRRRHLTVEIVGVGPRLRRARLGRHLIDGIVGVRPPGTVDRFTRQPIARVVGIGVVRNRPAARVGRRLRRQPAQHVERRRGGGGRHPGRPRLRLPR